MGDPSNKSHIACDECRSRKLRCSRDAAGCSRCVAERIGCHYSDRKPMGRPRKRRQDTVVDVQLEDMSNGPLSFGVLDDTHQYDFTGLLGPESTLDTLSNLDVLTSENSKYADPFDQNEYMQMPSFDAWNGSLQVGFESNCEISPTESYSVESQSQSQLSSIPNDAALSGSISCTCLPDLYLSLSSFLSLPPPTFPYSLAFLRKATAIAREVLGCQYCPIAYASALQNLMLLGTQIPLIINEYAKLLKHINSRASQESSINMRMGEDAPDSRHLHTGLPDCPMAINIEVTAEQWRKTARQVIRKDIRGKDASDEACLSGLVNAFESRQRTWHTRFRAEDRLTGHDHHCTDDNLHDPKLHVCMQIISRIKREIETLDLDDPT